MGCLSEAAKYKEIVTPFHEGKWVWAPGLDASPCHTDLSLEGRGVESCWTEHPRSSLTAHPMKSGFRALQQLRL